MDSSDYELGSAVLVKNHLGADDLITVENSAGLLCIYVFWFKHNGALPIVLVLWVINLS